MPTPTAPTTTAPSSGSVGRNVRRGKTTASLIVTRFVVRVADSTRARSGSGSVATSSASASAAGNASGLVARRLASRWRSASFGSTV